VYLIAGIAETNRAPFDVVEGESEIVAGHMVEYSGHGVRDVLPRRIRQHHPGLDAGLVDVPRRLDGADLAVAVRHPVARLAHRFDVVLELVLAVCEDLRSSPPCSSGSRDLPTLRYDQIMRLGWKIFIPVTLVWLVVVGVWIMSPWNIWK
jgi:NADH-quinone oxidoreductase subunit H